MGAVQPDLSNPTLTEEAVNQRPEDVYSLIDSLPSMEEREIVRAALCGTSVEATNAINRSLNALILGGKQDEEEEREIEGPDVCAESDGEEEGNIVVGDEEQSNGVRSATSKSDNTKSDRDNKANTDNGDDDEEAFGINVEEDLALN